MENESKAAANICLAEKEHGHKRMYLVWVHQADGFCYYKCEMCGWIEPDNKESPAIPQQPQGEICSWEWIKNDVGGFYHTTCGERIQSLLDIDGFKFCLFCGRKLSPMR